MSTISIHSVPVPATPCSSPSYDSTAENPLHYNIAQQLHLLSPTASRSSSLRGFPRDCNKSTSTVVATSQDASSVSTTASLDDDFDDPTGGFEIDVDTPVSMCMRWQDLIHVNSANAEFVHTYARANAMSLRVNPNNGLLGFRRATRRGSFSSPQEGSLGQTLADSSYTLPPKTVLHPNASSSSRAATSSKPTKPPTLLREIDVLQLQPKTSRRLSSATSLPSPPKPIPLPFPPKSAPPSTSTASKLCAITNSRMRSSLSAISPPGASYLPENNPKAMMSNSDRPTRSSKSVRSILKVSPIPKSEAPPPEPPNTTTDLADGEEELDESIFSSLRNVDLVSSRAPESARTRELKQKATVNKNVVAFLGGYKGQNSASHRIKVTGDILSRAKSIRKRAAEGQLSRKLHDARMRIPEEFQRSMDADLPRKGHRKRIRFPDDVDQLEIIYVFDVEDSDDEGNDDGAGEVDSVAAAVV
ncbi:hypothetical protein, variant [Aphanomyces invadans]|uniref:Uncharacterized protein n=1 Tax=Aphanomyces invadans TaxID=157072 RepID=A0A024UEX4_9STRA|nr:hypothetical protein, variant [Aphanomyces invadans]ETW04402.1 hypothetical protein, variant [Aphanomyces invadans]|eukprot:XP_008867358.1 hypothetical protein, variant [Aphanomyces invadans]